MSIPVYDLAQGKKALDGIFMIGETIKAEQPKRKRMARKRIVRRRVAVRGRGGRAEKTNARRKLVAKLFDKGLNRSQIMKETGASFITITKDLEALGKGKKTRARGRAKVKKQVKVKRVKKATRGGKTQSQKPVEGQEKEQKKEGE
jgi:hypothetical protein